MIYDVKALQGDLHEILDKMKTLVDNGDLASMIIIFKQKKEGEFKLHTYQGKASLFEMIGALDVTKADIVEEVLYQQL